jgi:cytidylate kinase
VKIFLVADLEERARRRLKDEGISEPSIAHVVSQSEAIAKRDRRDSERELSPLKQPEAAHVIDTTKLSFTEQVDRIVGLAEELTLP